MKIYLDTSVISGLYANDAPEIKGQTKDFFVRTVKAKNTFYIADLAIKELEATHNIGLRMKLIRIPAKYRMQILNTTKSIEELAIKYVEAEIIPKKYLPDALHIAMAVTHHIPILVSWNFEHMVKHTTRIQVNEINKTLDLPLIDICSPQEV